MNFWGLRNFFRGTAKLCEPFLTKYFCCEKIGKHSAVPEICIFIFKTEKLKFAFSASEKNNAFSYVFRGRGARPLSDHVPTVH